MRDSGPFQEEQTASYCWVWDLCQQQGHGSAPVKVSTWIPEVGIAIHTSGSCKLNCIERFVSSERRRFPGLSCLGGTCFLHHAPGGGDEGADLKRLDQERVASFAEMIQNRFIRSSKDKQNVTFQAG